MGGKRSIRPAPFLLVLLAINPRKLGLFANESPLLACSYSP